MDTKIMTKMFLPAVIYMFIPMMVINGAAATATADLLVNGEFEVDEVTSGYVPFEFGDWNGDLSEISHDIITPFEGTQVLVLQATSLDGPGQTVGSEVWQLIDLSAYRQIISTGRARVEGESYFNRVMGDSETDTLFSLMLTAYSGSPGDFPDMWNSGDNLAASSTQLFTDGNEQSWENLQVSLELPVDTDYIAFRISATENVFNDLDSPEFDGHYADATNLTIIPTPAAFAMLVPVLGMCLTGARKRRRCYDIVD